ncbi:MAG TPA: cohesin domain-containing protein [Candidatus Paceibacterota bacterium]|nr:cohesin domain-containing protein [Candidatus Paceibacterota bacterium]
MSIKEGLLRKPNIRMYAVMAAAAFAFCLPSAVRAATLFVSPATGTFRPNDTFTVTVRTNTQGAAVNAAEGVLRFDPSRVFVTSVTTNGSIFNLNVQEPDYSNTDGTISFAGVILNPGYSGASGTLLTVTLRARTPGTATLNFQSGAVLANDGQGTNVLTSMNGGTYTVLGEAAPTPAASPAATPSPVRDSLLPDVTSPTHPDPNRWYASNDPRFTWILPTGVDGVSWLIAPNSDGNPGNQLDGLVSEVSFTDQPDGATYFHIKFQRNGAFGPIAHFPFNVDTEPPLPFTVSRVGSGDETDPRPQLMFTTTDATSGVQSYRMRIGDGDWFDVPESPAERPFRMPVQAPGIHEVVVEAIDAAGLTARATLLVTVKSITVPVIETYPVQVSPGESFRVTGTAEPESTVTLYAYRAGIIPAADLDDDVVARVTAYADEHGNWQAVVPGLATGKYRLGAVSEDVRGAVSYPSETVTVRVGSWLARQIKSLPHWFAALPLLARILLLLAIAGLFWLLWWLLKHHRRHIFVAAKSDERDSSRLEAIISDIEEELAAVARLSRSRPLYPEERHLVTKLSRYRTALKKIAGTKKRTTGKKTK